MAAPILVTEVPSSLKQLARLVVRGFYSIEDSLIIDMLVRNPCMKEDDIAELLRFDRKYLRSRISTLRSDKFVQMRLKMETGPDGKAQKVNYYFINYRSFVNVVKYKLDLMRKRMETEERDATSRASFKCIRCTKTFTDLEADQLFDFVTQEFRCTYCGSTVEEDGSAMPKIDSRLMLARFNEQLQPLYDLLREVEDITLAPEILEPEPVDIDTIRGIAKHPLNRPDGQLWSGEATRNSGFVVEEAQIDVVIGDDDVQDEQERKERPVWMTESTVIDESYQMDVNDGTIRDTLQPSSGATTHNRRKEVEDVMAVLLQNEKQAEANGLIHKFNGIHVDSSDNEQDDCHKIIKKKHFEIFDLNEDDIAKIQEFPTIFVGGHMVPIHQIDYNTMHKMSSQERDNYIIMYQENYNYLHD